MVKQKAVNLAASVAGKTEWYRTNNRSASVEGEYDVVFVSCEATPEILALHRIEGWNQGKKVLWLGELWKSDLDGRLWERVLPLLPAFDAVLIPQFLTVPEAVKRSGANFVPVEHGVDSEVFAPTNYGQRGFDLTAIGRKPAELHDRLMRANTDRELAYFFDTFAAPKLISGPEHRNASSALLRNSLTYLCLPARFDDPARQQGQVEAGARYIEAIAAGSVPVGAFCGDRGDWCRFIRELPDDPDAAVTFVRDLRADGPAGIANQRDMVATGFDRLDWAHRWADVLEMIGCSPSATLTSRIERLGQKAAALRNQDQPHGAEL